MKYRLAEIAPGYRQVILVTESDEELQPSWFNDHMCSCKVVADVDDSVDGKLTWRCPQCGNEFTIERVDDDRQDS